MNKHTSNLLPDTPVQFVSGVGPVMAEKLKERNIHTVLDLLYIIPRSYEVQQGLTAIRDLEAETLVKIKARVDSVKKIRSRKGRMFYELRLEDGTGTITARWFNYFAHAFRDVKIGSALLLSGKVQRYKGKLQFIHPEIKPDQANAAQEQNEDISIQPIFPEIEGIPSRRLRNIIAAAADAIQKVRDPLPQSIIQFRKLPPLNQSLEQLHAPANSCNLESLNTFSSPWHQRLIYGEFLGFQLGIASKRQAITVKKSHSLSASRQHIEQLARSMFSFELTTDQARVVEEISSDLQQTSPMHRLVQGDVGSGKTAVAFIAAASAINSGFQVAIMAPTELLAEQHYQKALQAFPADTGIVMLCGAQKPALRRRVVADIAVGRAKLIVGTHALIQDSIQYKKLGLGIIDEQHRFGVMQRAKLIEKGRDAQRRVPHILVMTATPIPRTLAMTVYGDLDVSVIEQLPPGRKPIKTRALKDKERSTLYDFLHKELQQKRQVYIVYPLVEESESELLEGIKDATSMAEQLQRTIFPQYTVGLLHGRMDATEKQQLMGQFRSGAIHLLVSTTVIEVGIDVPQATTIVIEHAERFGLSQLHQLRGRVGRGGQGGNCFLMLSKQVSKEAYQRIKTLESHANGFKVAEADLTIRGPGDMIGTRQSGLPRLSFGNLIRDHRIMAAAHEDARRIIKKDPALQRLPELRESVLKQWEGRLALAKVG